MVVVLSLARIRVSRSFCRLHVPLGSKEHCRGWIGESCRVAGWLCDWSSRAYERYSWKLLEPTLLARMLSRELFEMCLVSSLLILSLSLICCIPSIVLPPTMDISQKTTFLGKTLISQMTPGHQSDNPVSTYPLHTSTKMSTVTESALGYKVADISLAEFGRKETKLPKTRCQSNGNS